MPVDVMINPNPDAPMSRFVGEPKGDPAPQRERPALDINSWPEVRLNPTSRKDSSQWLEKGDYRL